MTIGILYESKEWSSYALRDDIAALGEEAKLIDMQSGDAEKELRRCDFVVNRVFPSAVFRGHQKSLDQMPAVIGLLKANGIPMINSEEAYYYDISKALSTKTLAENGFPVPKVFAVFSPSRIPAEEELAFPCVVKPDCGGRTNFTFIINEYRELKRNMAGVPDIQFMAEEYIDPEFGYLTRIEVIDRSCRLIVKRSVTSGGLSAYNLGSTFTGYDDCSEDIQKTAVGAMDLLRIEAGSVDIIENKSGFYIIDVNSSSNASEDNTEMFGFDLMKETAAYAVKKYREMKKGGEDHG